MFSRRATVVLMGVLIAGGSLSACSKSASPASTSTTSSTTSTTSTTTTTSTTAVVPSTAGSTTTTTTTSGAAGDRCAHASLRVTPDKSQGAAGTIDLGFTIANTGAAPCVLDGYPAIALVPVSGTVTPVISHSGQGSVFSIGPAEVDLGAHSAQGAGLVLEYSDVQSDGQTSCPQIEKIDISLPGVAGAFSFDKSFYPCGAPNLSVSAVLTGSQFQAAFS